MNKKQLLLSTVALGCAAMLLAPAEASFSTIGGSLGVGQRDVRVFNNFSDVGSNNNVRGFPDFPGYLGAEQAIWKGAAEWSSAARSPSGGIDQPEIGNGGGNFDVLWLGNANGVGGTNDNIVSAINTCSGGIIAFTETPISNGWKIRYCDNNFAFADGPANISTIFFDLQGVMTHEYGHALGLGHSTCGGATMFPSGSPGSEAERSISSDDINGLQFIYGAMSGIKPVISSVSTAGGNITITGTGFDAAATNEVWFTNGSVTGTGADARVRIFNVASTGGGTSITVAIPASAGMGDVMVKNAGGMNTDLSNAFPTTLGEPLFGASVFTNGSGSNPACFMSTSLPQLGRPFNMQVDASGHPGGAGFSGVLVYAGSALIPIAAGELLVNLGSPQYGFLIGPSGGGIDPYSVTPVANPSFLGAQATAQGFTFSLTSTVLCNAESITLGAAP